MFYNPILKLGADKIRSLVKGATNYWMNLEEWFLQLRDYFVDEMEWKFNRNVWTNVFFAFPAIYAFVVGDVVLASLFLGLMFTSGLYHASLASIRYVGTLEGILSDYEMVGELRELDVAFMSASTIGLIFHMAIGSAWPVLLFLPLLLLFHFWSGVWMPIFCGILFLTITLKVTFGAAVMSAIPFVIGAWIRSWGENDNSGVHFWTHVGAAVSACVIISVAYVL